MLAAFWKFLRPHTIRGTILATTMVVTRALMANPEVGQCPFLPPLHPVPSHKCNHHTCDEARRQRQAVQVETPLGAVLYHAGSRCCLPHCCAGAGIHPCLTPFSIID